MNSKYMIDRYEWVSRHNPTLKQVDFDSPLSVGNGELAYTVDVTGLQTLYEEYAFNHCPLCTMSQWGWHTSPVSEARYAFTLEDVEMTQYPINNRYVSYASDEKEGNEEAYRWLRTNPHRLNLARIGLLWEGKRIKKEDLSQISQTLYLFEGKIESTFEIHHNRVRVTTVCAESDCIGLHIESEALGTNQLSVGIEFPYGSPDISGADWIAEERHQTKLTTKTSKRPEETLAFITRQLDKDCHQVSLVTQGSIEWKPSSMHTINVQAKGITLKLTVHFSLDELNENLLLSFEQVLYDCKMRWHTYWTKGGAIELYKSKDSRAFELERRIVLSQYLMGIQTTGTLPPQETGLTCNSWYGKFHLEMHIWHCSWLALWNRGELLERSLIWYRKILPEAYANATRNGYKGARWPKMVSYTGIDSPSWIGTLLVWQQPHLIYMLEMLYNTRKNDIYLEQNWDLIKATADFMCDFVSYNQEKDCYELIAPLIPAQEEHKPMDTHNPTFEVEYWRFTLLIAVEWAKRLCLKGESWLHVAQHMAELPNKDGLYLAHEKCLNTFTHFAKDHPSMLGAFGFINSDRVNQSSMEATLLRVIETWDFNSMWGWDFALMAMTCIRLNKPELAIDLLLMETPKNTYVISGNNYQKSRQDLPLYLPGNGSLLMVLAMMTAGYGSHEAIDTLEVYKAVEGNKTHERYKAQVDNKIHKKLPGFPDNGDWEVRYENIEAFPY